MRLLKKRETIIENIAYMGIMASINIIFVVLTYFVPFLLFVLVFILPLCSAIISYYCKKVYFPIYLVVVSAVCLLIDMSDTIFYVIPSLITGFFFGLLIDKKIPSIFIIVAITVVQFGLSMASIPLIQLITKRNIVDDMAAIFKLSEFEYLGYVKYTFIYFIAFVQTILSFIVMHSELNKFGIAFIDKTKRVYLLDIATLVCVGLSVLFGFLIPEFSFIPLLTSLMFMVGRLMLLNYCYYKLYLIELGIIFFGSIFFVALIYSKLTVPLGLLTFGVFPTLISFACLINNCLLSKRNKDTIIE